MTKKIITCCSYLIRLAEKKWDERPKFSSSTLKLFMWKQYGHQEGNVCMVLTFG